MIETRAQIIKYIETLLLASLRKGDAIRHPHRYNGSSGDVSETVDFVIREFDRLKCPWSIQNAALSYLNNADSERIWDDLHRRQLPEIAQCIYSENI